MAIDVDFIWYMTVFHPINEKKEHFVWENQIQQKNFWATAPIGKKVFFSKLLYKVCITIIVFLKHFTTLCLSLYLYKKIFKKVVRQFLALLLLCVQQLKLLQKQWYSWLPISNLWTSLLKKWFNNFISLKDAYYLTILFEIRFLYLIWRLWW